MVKPDTTRIGSSFYKLDLRNPLRTGNFKRDGGEAFEGTFEYKINQMAEMAATTGRIYDGNDRIKEESGKNANPNNDAGKVGKRMSIFPDGYGRIFHPTISGHILIADSVLYAMAKRQAASKKLDMNAQAAAINLACPNQKPTPTKPLCTVYGDATGKHECWCGEGDNAKKYKQKDGDDPCGYTTMPPDSLLATPSSTPPPGPTASTLVVWHVPPVTGPMFYSFYKESAGFRKSLVAEGCGAYKPSSKDFIPCNDIGKKECRVDGGNRNTRYAPGTVEMENALEGCKYVEDVVGTAELRCPYNRTFKCKAPDDNLTDAITPDKGRCIGTNPKDVIDNVQMLIMVCEMFKDIPAQRSTS